MFHGNRKEYEQMSVIFNTGNMRVRTKYGTKKDIQVLVGNTKECIDAINEEGQNFINEIEKKGQEFSNKIPDDYDKLKEDVNTLKQDLTNLETLLRAIQDKLNSGSSVDTVTVNEINNMIVEYFENKTVSEVEA